jgi:imidazolonepropionase-like amidohydrolase
MIVEPRQRRTGLACLVAVTAAAMSSMAAAADTLVVENVTVIDGTGSPSKPAMTVVIADGRFKAVAPTSYLGGVAGRKIDGRGKFLIPGLMDMHVHLRGGTEITPEGIRKVALKRDEGIAALHSYLYSGVTSIYDAGNVPEYIFEFRGLERSGDLLSPRIFATGGIATQPGSHGSGAGSTDIESWPEARAALDAHLALQPDLLKLTFEERGWGARPLIPLLDVALMQRVIEYTNDHGIRTVVHTSSELRAREAIFAGIDALAHPVIQGPVSDSFVKLMGAKRVPMVTTLTIGDNYSRLVENPDHLDQPLYKASLSPAEIATLKSQRRKEWSDSRWTWWMKVMTPVAQENLRKLHDGGAILVVGTDQSSGPAVHRELELLAAAGLPPLAIVRMATLNGAVFLGREKDMGSIEVGKLADAVRLNADPGQNIENARDIALVVKGGAIIDESQLQLAGGPVPSRTGH